MDLIDNFTNTYNRNARLSPVLISVLPIILMIALLYTSFSSIFSICLSLLSSCGILFFLANISRIMGKKLEVKLYNEWGGKPTTILLRHEDKTIDKISKERYHNILSKKIGMSFPSREDENIDRTTADDIYIAATKWLLNQTRDKNKYSLLFKENINYGFHRNLLALKPLGIISNIITIFWTLVYYKIIVFINININALINLPGKGIIIVIFSIILLGLWLLYVKKSIIKIYANIYAESLINSCDNIEDNVTNKIL